MPVAVAVYRKSVQRHQSLQLQKALSASLARDHGTEKPVRAASSVHCSDRRKGLMTDDR